MPQAASVQGPDPMVQHRGMLSRVVTGLGGCNVSDLFWHFLGEKNSKTNYRQCCCMSSEKHRKIRLQEVCLLGLHYCIFTFLERRGRKAPFCCTTWMCFAVHSVTVSQVKSGPMLEIPFPTGASTFSPHKRIQREADTGNSAR